MSVHGEHDDEHDASAEALAKAEDEHLVADIGVRLRVAQSNASPRYVICGLNPSSVFWI